MNTYKMFERKWGMDFSGEGVWYTIGTYKAKNIDHAVSLYFTDFLFMHPAKDIEKSRKIYKKSARIGENLKIKQL